MSLSCLRLVLCHAARAVYHPVCPTSPAALLLPPTLPPCRPLSGYLGMVLLQWSRFCTAAEGSKGAEGSEPQKKKSKLNARVTFGSTGRNIHQIRVQLLGDDGADLGVVHRAEALRMMDKNGLKLVAINELSNPPVYQLMSGKHIHEQQLKLKENQKAMAAVHTIKGTVQMKELTLFLGIAPHDLENKLKKAAHLLERKHHVKLTLRKRIGSSSETAMDKVLDQMLEKMPVPVGFVTPTTLTREGRAAMCVLRPPSAKELKAAQQETQNPKEPPRPEPGRTYNTASTSEPDPPKDSEQR